MLRAIARAEGELEGLWRIELLGELRAVSRDRILTRFRTRKTAALLAYLAFYLDRSHPREMLIELLWPEAEPALGQRSLRTALSSLRHQLEPPGMALGSVIIADRSLVRLNPEAVTTDVIQFQALCDPRRPPADRAASLAAVELYRGDLLPGFFEEWVLTERRRLAEAYLWGLCELIHCLEQAGEYRQATQWARRAVAADPLREEGQQALIRLLVARGETDAARDQYHQFERLMESELGTVPSPEIQALVKQCGTERRRPFKEIQGGPAAPVLAPVPASPGPIGYLPRQLTRFFGRQQEIERLEELLLDPETPLITLTGPGGTGKTRLALQVAQRLRETFEGRVWFVSLLELTDPRLILDRLMEVLRLPCSAEAESLHLVVTFLSQRPSLLMLDNFEHLVDGGADQVHSLLERTETLTVLVTSRRVLGIPGEQEYPVPPLEPPVLKERGGNPACARAKMIEQQAQEELAPLLQFASMQLFIDRAQAVRPDFQLTTANARALGALCARLDGLPLAIELAAARIGVMTPQQMLARLDQRFELLAGRQRAADTRHHSLRAALDWSFQLLSPELQRFFARLSVFRGGWDLAAAEEVGEASEALEHLSRLRDASFIEAEAQGAETRYSLLETLREYAAEQLFPEEGAALSLRHARYYVAFSEAAEIELGGGPRQADWLAQLQQEVDNLRVALAWTTETGEAELGMRLGGALRRFWRLRGYGPELRDCLTRLLALPEAAAPTAARAKALLTVAFHTTDRRTVLPLLEESLAIRRALGDRPGEAAVLTNLGNAAGYCQDRPLAHAYYQQSLAISRELGIVEMIAGNLNNMSLLAEAMGETEAALTYRAESERLWLESGSVEGKTGVLIEQGNRAHQQGNSGIAHEKYAEALELARSTGLITCVDEALSHLAPLAIEQRDQVQARLMLVERLAICREAGGGLGQASLMEAFAALAMAQGRAEGACRLLGAAEAVRDAYGAIVGTREHAEHERLVTAIRRELGDARFLDRWNEGRAMTADRALDFGLQVTA